MRLLVFGQSGQVARIADCNAVINAAAWTAVNRTKAHQSATTVVKGDAPGCHGADLRGAWGAVLACLD